MRQTTVLDHLPALTTLLVFLVESVGDFFCGTAILSQLPNTLDPSFLVRVLLNALPGCMLSEGHGSPLGQSVDEEDRSTAMEYVLISGSCLFSANCSGDRIPHYLDDTIESFSSCFVDAFEFSS